ncbi:MAG: ribosome modulation factor [Pseudomonadales bacterium]|nr:ribosome modulation factor [Pseudomonadales bacterium]OUR87973.1 ribosome modulation factor [Gammaproteobacteria bacterium 42_54_T18]
MRRQKRDKSNRAYSRGHSAGLQGKSKEQCPYTDVTTRQFWLNGWRDGRTDQWQGFTGVSGIHKIANIG